MRTDKEQNQQRHGDGQKDDFPALVPLAERDVRQENDRRRDAKHKPACVRVGGVCVCERV